MKLAIAAKGAPTVDPRAAGGRQQVDSSSPDSGGKGFDGLLAEMSSDAPGATLDPGAALTPPASAPTSGVADLASNPAISLAQHTSVGPATTPSAGASTTNETLVNALMDILGQIAGNKTTATTTDSETKQPDTQSGGSSQDDFGAVLKKLKTKDEPATADTSASNQPAATPSDLLAMIALGIAAPGQAASQPPAGTSPDERAKLPTNAAAPLTNAGATPPVETAEMLVSDVAMSTHLAPVNPAQERSQAKIAGKSSGDDPHDETLLSSQPDTAQPETALAASATLSDESKVTLSLDQAAAPVHGKSEPMPSATQLGVAFGPTRAIATAITTIAAQATAQAAANVPDDSAKAPLTVARTLTLQMNPAQLGTVDIKLHMTGQALDVQLTVSSQETLGIVSRERDTLAAALHDQTYQLNSLVIQDGGSAAASSGGNAAASGGNNATQGNGFGSAGSDRQTGGGSDSRSGGGQSQSRQPPAGQGRAPAPRASDSGGGPLFV